MVEPDHAVVIKRHPLLATHELRGFYRYRDLFQLVPAGASDPRPDGLMGWYGLTVEYRLDPQTAPKRDADLWAHDHRERARVQHLHAGVAQKGREQPDPWLEADENIRHMHRPLAIARELSRLLSVLTNYPVRVPRQDHVWVLADKSGGARWSQMWWPSFANGSPDAFTEPDGQLVELIYPDKYYARLRGYGSGHPTIDLPLDIDDRLNAYFGLSSDDKLAFARACELLGVASEVWLTSRSASLAAAVFAVEALLHAQDPEPAKCGECSALLSAEHCAKCGAPRHRLTRRFRDFVAKYAGTSGFDTKALYGARSDLAHRGILLRADEFDSGFTWGGKDDQSAMERDTMALVRRVLLRWLEERGPSRRA